jgi:hypothetical protein
MAYQSSPVSGASDCVDATITLGAEVGDAIPIAIQLLDAAGNDLDYVEEVELVMFLNAARTAYVVTGGSTGIAIGTDGALSTVVAKKRFFATCEADGDIDLSWTDTAHEVAFLGVKLPNGKMVMSAALTTAA